MQLHSTIGRARHIESVEPDEISEDGLFDYYVEQSSGGSCDVHVVGPKQSPNDLLCEAVIFHGFTSRASAQIWIDVHKRSSDLSDFELLRSSRATHQWAQSTHHLLDVMQAENLAQYGGFITTA